MQDLQKTLAKSKRFAYNDKSTFIERMKTEPQKGMFRIMPAYEEMSQQQLAEEKAKLEKLYADFCAKNLKLDMSRGKPGKAQLDITNDMLDCLDSASGFQTENGMDVRNYGGLDGIPEAKCLFADMLGVTPAEVLVGGNSSLNMMYDTVARAMLFGTEEGCLPWGKQEKLKFLCPVPGYDRHFAITEQFGIEMINVAMTPDGPDMDAVEKLVSADDTIKGIWCIPMYSNPEGITYSDETVKRFAALKPAAKDFRIFWDNAYCVHHLSEDRDQLLNIMDACKACGSEDMVYEFASTSKISFPGAGVAVMVASEKNMARIKKQVFFQTIGSDKINQLRHVKYFKDMAGIDAQMKKHAAIIKPKFDLVLEVLEKEIAPLGIASWNKPKGGYFISFNVLAGCATRVYELCKNGGVTLTKVGATFPYGKDPQDSNIRIAPTFPPLEELALAMQLFCICVRLAAVEKLLAK